MVDRYLDSPHYGERWGKYWLDAAGYADSNGYFNADTDPSAGLQAIATTSSARSTSTSPGTGSSASNSRVTRLVGYGPGRDIDISEMTVDQLAAAHYLRNSPDGTGVSDGNPDEVLNDKYAVIRRHESRSSAPACSAPPSSAPSATTTSSSRSRQADYYQLHAILAPRSMLSIGRSPNSATSFWKRRLSRRSAAATNQELDEEIAALKAAHVEWTRTHRERGTGAVCR